MNRPDYERSQLELIAAQYTLRGYHVQLEPLLDNVPLRFDAIASKENPREMIVIELVNRRRHETGNMIWRAAQISRQFAGQPHVALDIRYLDQPDERVSDARERATASVMADISAVSLGALLKQRLTPLSPILLDRSGTAKSMASDWAFLARIVRTFCATKNIGAEDDSVVDLYNELLQRLQIAGAEQLTKDGPIQDLSELYEQVMVAMEGGAIDGDCAHQLRFHLKSLRDQLRQHI